MVLVSGTVKAEEKKLPTVSQGAVRADTVNKSKRDAALLIDYLLKLGKDDELDDVAVTSLLGLPNALPVRVVEERTPYNPKSWQYRVVALVYAKDTDSGGPLDKKNPMCIVIYGLKGAGHDNKGYWFRLSPGGELKKATLDIGKNDDSGTPIRGAGVQMEQDITSVEVKKAFDSEFAYWTKDWIKKQKKAAPKASAK